MRLPFWEIAHKFNAFTLTYTRLLLTMHRSICASVWLLLTILPATPWAQATYNLSPKALQWQQAQALQAESKYLAALPEWSFYKRLVQEGEERLYAQFKEALNALRSQQADGVNLARQFTRQHTFHPLAHYARYELGHYFFLQKDYPQVILELETVETDRLTVEYRRDTQFMLGYAYFEQEQYLQAYQQLAPLKSYANPYRSAALYYCGYLRYREQKYAEAIADLQAAAEEKTFSASAHYLIALSHYERQQYREVLAYAEQQSKNLSNNADFYLLVGDACYQLTNYPKAAEYFEKYQSSRSINSLPTSARYRIGYSYYAAEKYKQAIDVLREVASQPPKEKDDNLIIQQATYYLGLAYLRTDQKQSALLAFNQARKATHQPEVARLSQFYYGKLCYELNRREEAIEVLRQYVLEYPNSPETNEAQQLITRSYLFNNDYPKALAYLESLRSLNQQEQEIYQQLAFLQAIQAFNSEKYDDALPLLQKALRYTPNRQLRQQTYLLMGDIHSAKRQYNEAIQHYQSALDMGKISDAYTKAIYGIAYAFYNQQRYNEAQKQLELFLAQREAPKSLLAEAYVRLADCHYVQKNYFAALDNYQKALQHNFADKDYILYQQAIIYDIQNKEAQAIPLLMQIIQKGAQNFHYDKAMFQLGQIALEQKQYNMAVQHFSSLLEQKPNSPLIPYALLRRAIAYNNLRNSDKAIEDYRRIILSHTTHPIAPVALMGVQELLIQSGRNEEFDSLLAIYKRNNPESENLASLEFEAAKNMFFTEKYGKAIASFSLFIQEHPNSPYVHDARYYLAESYFRTGDLAKAETLYMQVIREKKSSGYTRALQRMGEYYFSQKEYQRTLVLWQELLQAAMNRRERTRALQGLMEAHYALQAYDSTLHYSQLLLEQESSNTFNYTHANLFKAKALIGKQQFNDAQSLLSSIARDNPDSFGAEAQYLIGEILYRRKQYQASLQALFTLNEQFPSQIGWRLQGYLLIADNYLALGDSFQAKATLQSLIDNARDPDIVARARQKLAGIK